MQEGIDERAILPTISVPTLTVQCVDDEMGKLDESRYVTGLIPGAKLVELAGNEHPPSPRRR